MRVNCGGDDVQTFNKNMLENNHSVPNSRFSSSKVLAP